MRLRPAGLWSEARLLAALPLAALPLAALPRVMPPVYLAARRGLAAARLRLAVQRSRPMSQ